MAKGAASESKLGSLHAKVADVFLKVLETYEKRLEAIDNIDLSEMADEIEAAMVAKLFEEGSMPSPAMLSAITKFLKDNEVTFEIEKIDEISDTQRRLQARAKSRPNLAQLKVVGEE